MRAKAFNPQVFLEFSCYCVFGILTLYLVSSGAYLSYVTPRMKPYLYFTVIVLLVWACAGAFRLFRPQHKTRTAHCFVLVIPILLLLLPHTPLGSSNFSENYAGGPLSGQGGQNPNTAQTSPPLQTEPSDSVAPAVGNSSKYPGLDAAAKKITVTSNEQFGFWLSELYSNMEKYKGYTVAMTGFVFKDSEFMASDEFVPARLTMSCCVADLQPAGFICKYDKASELQQDTWVTVEGTFFIGQYEYGGQTYDDPQIAVTKITPAEKVDGYVYPSY